MSRACALIFGACLLGGPAVMPTPAQLPPERTPFGQGTHALRRIFYDAAQRNLTPLRRAADIDEPARTVVIVLGEATPLEEIDKQFGKGLTEFVKRGGALLVATDRPTQEALENNFQLAVNGGRLALPPGNLTGYREVRACPFALPVWGTGPGLFRPAIMPGRLGAVLPVATNNPSYLEISGRLPGRLDFEAALPRDCVLPDGRPTRIAFLLAVGGDVGRGRVLVIADHSIFINDMMLQRDNGNLDFAYRCADWLLDGPEGKRDRVLFYEEGTVRTDFDIPLKEVPLPPLTAETLLPLIDETIEGLERENAFNEMLLDLVDWDSIRQGVVMALTILLGLYGVVRLGLFRYRHDTSVPPLGRVLPEQPAAAVIMQRNEELLRQGNLWEAARALARHLFDSAGVPLVEDEPPAVEAPGGWWQRLRWRWRLGRLWRLAVSDAPVRVSRRRFAGLAKEVTQVQAALDARTLRFL